MPRHLLLIVAYSFMVIGSVLPIIIALLRRSRAKRNPPVEGRRCLCGYSALGLEIPRCPECGRMIGFDKSPDELGVSEEQMRAQAQRRKATRGSANIP